ncbi:MAG: CHAD domain-containing protein [Bradyrhizobium sp.]
MAGTEATRASPSGRAVAGRRGRSALQEKERTGNIIASDAKQGEGGAATSSGDAMPDGTAPTGSELELKLCVESDRLADFNEAPLIAASAQRQGARAHLKAVYYDTPERVLWRNGLSFRVRQSGSRFKQTVKTEIGDDPLRRGEWETAVPSIAPDVALAMPFIPAKLRSDLESRPLEPVFVSDIHRHQRIVDLPSGTIEVAFDRGVLTSGDRSMPVSEIELELKRGSASAIYELALRLAEHGPVRPSIRSKAARGFDLAADRPPAVKRPRKLRLDPAMPLEDAFAAILRSCFRQLLQSLPAAEDGRNPEGIHQLRVALRRLRSALDLMRSVGSLSKVESLRSEAKWLTQSLSAARDWDIFLTKTLPAITQVCPSVAGFDALAEGAEKHRSAAYREAGAVLAGRRCAGFVLELGAWIEARGWRSDVALDGFAHLAEPAIDFARRILPDHYVKVLKRGRHFKSLAVEERHRLRLAVKRLRYVCDFLLPLYGRRKFARRFAEKLAVLQDELGSFNDMSTTASLPTPSPAPSPPGATTSSTPRAVVTVCPRAVPCTRLASPRNWATSASRGRR